MLSKRIAFLHLWLGLLCAVPMFGWTSSGFLGALPRSATAGVHYEALELPRLRVAPVEAVARARGLVGGELKVSSMTLEQRDGRLSWLIIAGSQGVRVDGESGEARRLERSGPLDRYFSEAHFLWFAGGLRMPLMVGFTAAMLALLVTGLALAGRRLFSVQ